MATEGRYNKIQTAATGFVLSTCPKTPGTNEVDADRFYSYLGPGFHMSWGHKFFISTKPPLQKAVDGPTFIAHQSGMATSLQTWEIRVTNCCVDVQQRTAVVRADFLMTVPGHEPVLNDIVFWIQLDDRGEKIIDACEFVDPAASTELMSKMGGTKTA